MKWILLIVLALILLTGVGCYFITGLRLAKAWGKEGDKAQAQQTNNAPEFEKPKP